MNWDLGTATMMGWLWRAIIEYIHDRTKVAIPIIK